MHLALTFSFGPVAWFVSSISQAAATNARMRLGWFRAAFNMANYFLTDLSAWIVFASLMRVHQGVLWGAFAATLAAAVECTVNTALLGLVIGLASNGKASAWAV